MVIFATVSRVLLAAFRCALGALSGSAAGAEGASLPRFRLEVGQELTYRQNYEFKYGKGDNAGILGHKTDWQVWVVRHNDDGSWRIVFRSSDKSWQVRGKGEKSEHPANNSLAYCDIFPDGRFVPNESLGYRLNPQVLFPRLPGDAAAAAKGWEDFHKRDAVRSRYNAQASRKDDGLWAFDEVRESPLDAIYLSSSRSRFFFDLKRGLVQRAEGENTQGYGFDGKGTSTTELAGVKEHDADWVKQFAAETDRYFTANKAYEDLTQRAEKEPKESESLLAKAEAALQEVRGQLTLPILREQVDDQLKGHAQRARWITEDAKRIGELLGKPAAAFATKDLEGKAHSLDGYRGKVVILDFWYRGCGWCIRAMPQVNQLAEDFKGEPVAVLGMNIDQDEKDARFVVEKMKLTYPVLKAEGLPQKYGVSGYPTLIIIDQAWKVHDVHVGYSPTLRDEVAKSVKGLLTRK
jgi:thiol-disulfide isomerase/thioredoxin